MQREPDPAPAARRAALSSLRLCARGARRDVRRLRTRRARRARARDRTRRGRDRRVSFRRRASGASIATPRRATGAHRRILEAWSNGLARRTDRHADGRQGARRPGVTLVGVLLADVALGMPDFRAGERAFQLLDRKSPDAPDAASLPGRVIVQTYRRAITAWSPRRRTTTRASRRTSSSIVVRRATRRSSASRRSASRVPTSIARARSRNRSPTGVRQSERIRRRRAARSGPGARSSVCAGAIAGSSC